MTLREFLKHKTNSLELCAIREGGWVKATCWIDHEDLFHIPPELAEKEVTSDQWGELAITNESSAAIDIPCHFIDVQTIDNGSMFCGFCGTKQVADQELNLDEMAEQIQNKLRSITSYEYNGKGLLKCKKMIKDYGFDIVLDSVETAMAQYLIKDKDGKYTEKSIAEVFRKIGGIAKNKHYALTKPYLADVIRIKNYAQKVFFINYYEMTDLTADLNNLLYYFFKTNQYDGKAEDILALLRGSKDKDEFFDKIDALKETCLID